MNYLRSIAGLVGLMIVLPIWFYLMYQILVRVQATELMFFLFWIYVPAYIFIQVVTKMTTEKWFNEN